MWWRSSFATWPIIYGLQAVAGFLLDESLKKWNELRHNFNKIGQWFVFLYWVVWLRVFEENHKKKYFLRKITHFRRFYDPDKFCCRLFLSSLLHYLAKNIALVVQNNLVRKNFLNPRSVFKTKKQTKKFWWPLRP